MNTADIIRLRLLNQQIAAAKFTQPAQIVNYMVAMQAQEYAMAKWAIGLRVPGITESAVEKAFNDGLILRTHLMRPTWHFVSPADIRWLLALTAPRVNAASAFMHRKTGLDAKIFKKSNEAIYKALRGGKHLTRNELKSVLEKVKIKGDGVLMSYLTMRAELDAIICSGARRGKQFTYALLEERVPILQAISYDEALGNFALRYFSSRGPATIYDFSMWSGLTLKEVKEGVALVNTQLKKEVIDGKEYLVAEESLSALENDKSKNNKPHTTCLLPDYDEYGMSYKDRSAIYDAGKMALQISRGNPVFNRMIIVDGKIAGTWQRLPKGNSVNVETHCFENLNNRQQHDLKNAVKRYTAFAGK